MNFPASVLGVYFDKKLLLVVSFLANGLLACFTPYLITFTYTGSVEVLKRFFQSTGPGNWKLLIVLRIVQGLIQVSATEKESAMYSTSLPLFHSSGLPIFHNTGFHVADNTRYKREMVSPT